MKSLHYCWVILLSCFVVTSYADTQGVDFIEPKNGDVLSSPFKVRFLVTGMEIRPAGDLSENTGHHHLIINSESIQAGNVVPADEKHIHFGKGQTETTVDLPKGRHRLTLQFANGLHQSYGEQMSKSIEIVVE